MSVTERKPRKYTKSRGKLDTTRNDDEEPMEVRMDLTWSFITASTGSGTPEPIDVLKQKGEAAAWVSTDDDQCQPYCIDIEVNYAPACSTVDDEFAMAELFRYEQIDFSLKDGTFSISGKCNRTELSTYRQA